MARLVISAAFLFLAAGLAGDPAEMGTGPGEKPFVRRTGPTLLSYSELVQLLHEEEPAGKVREKLDRLLTVPFVSNEAYYAGAKPLSTSHPALGDFLRVCHWNIEEGLRLSEIQLLMADPEAFEELLVQQGKKEQERNRILRQARLLREANVIVLNEADRGMKRTGYRDVARELAESLQMNYAFGVQFAEVDPIHLGVETFEELPDDDREELEQIISVNPPQYKGLHGLAVLSRYPIWAARLVPFEHKPYDWYRDEKKRGLVEEKISPTLAGRLFLRKATRKIRRGGRTTLIVDLAVPELHEGTLTVVATHLENRATPKGRQRQMRELLEGVRNIQNPLILAGDLNTSGRDRRPITVRRFLLEQFGGVDSWLKRGMQYGLGVPLAWDATLGRGLRASRTLADPTVRNVFLLAPNPERRLFRTVEDFRFADGYRFDFRGDPERSAGGRKGTLANSNERARKGFKPSYELGRTVGALGQFKLDWIFVKAFLKTPRDKDGPYRFAPHFGRTLRALNHSVPGRLSDHNPMIVDLPFEEPLEQNLTPPMEEETEEPDDEPENNP